jgi:hypothetical protein
VLTSKKFTWVKWALISNIRMIWACKLDLKNILRPKQIKTGNNGGLLIFYHKKSLKKFFILVFRQNFPPIVGTKNCFEKFFLVLFQAKFSSGI